MKKILQTLFEHKTLSREEAREVLYCIGKGLYNEHEICAFMTVYLMRTVTIDELCGFRDALLDLCIPLHFDCETLDIVGTGGDGKNTFNISTLASFIVAGAGHQVTKHGNYGVSSVSGSSNVMETFGYRFKNDQSSLARELEATNICFLHAPYFHPALKIVAPVRKNLGMRTFFNMLGPLVNPATPSTSVIGTYNLELARIYGYLLQESRGNYTIIHSQDGYDEISLTADTKLVTRDGDRIMTPQQLGKRSVDPADIYGGSTVKDTAKLFLKILKGEGSWAQTAVVTANAAIALDSTGKCKDYEEAFATALESLESGSAYQSFQNLINLQ